MNIVKATLSVLLMAASLSHATTIGIHGFALHDKPGEKYVTPGAYLNVEGFSIGAYNNSNDRLSTYVGFTFNMLNVDHLLIELTAAILSGYGKRLVSPVLVPSARYAITDQTAARIVFAPKVREGQQANAIQLNFEYTFKE